MKKKTVLAAIIVVIAGILLCGCSASKKSGNAGSSGKIKIGVPVYTLGHRYWVTWLDEIERLGKEKGFDVIQSDSKYDAAKQISLMEDMVSQAVNAIILCPVDPGGVGVAIKDVEEAGVHVILSDLEVVDTSGKRIASGLVGLETFETGKVEGRWAADYAKKHFGGKANVAVLSYPVEQPCLDAERGFLEALKEELGAGNVKTVIQNGQASQEQGMTVTENILSSNKDINMLWGANDECALGGLAAMEARGIKDALVCGFYAIPDVMELIKQDNSMFKVSMFLPPRIMADQAVSMALKAVKGEQFDYEVKVAFDLCDKSTVESMME